MYRKNIHKELVQPLLTDLRVHTSDPCRVCIGRCILGILKVIASLLIPKSVILRLVLFRCPDPDTESIKTITEATRENIRAPTWKPYGVYCRAMINYYGICQAQGIIQSLTYSGGFGPLGFPNSGKPADRDRDTNPTRRILSNYFYRLFTLQQNYLSPSMKVQPTSARSMCAAIEAQQIHHTRFPQTIAGLAAFRNRSVSLPSFVSR